MKAKIKTWGSITVQEGRLTFEGFNVDLAGEFCSPRIGLCCLVIDELQAVLRDEVSDVEDRPE